MNYTLASDTPSFHLSDDSRDPGTLPPAYLADPESLPAAAWRRSTSPRRSPSVQEARRPLFARPAESIDGDDTFEVAQMRQHRPRLVQPGYRPSLHSHVEQARPVADKASRPRAASRTSSFQPPSAGKGGAPAVSSQTARIEPMQIYDEPTRVGAVRSKSHRRKWLIGAGALLLVAGAAAGGIVGSRLGRKDDSESTTGSPSSAGQDSSVYRPSSTTNGRSATRTSSSARATSTYPGLDAGSYNLSAVRTGDNCTAADLGFECSTQFQATLQISGTTNHYSVTNALNGASLTVLPQPDPTSLSFSMTTPPRNTTAGCLLDHELIYDLDLTNTFAFDFTVTGLFSNAAAGYCSDLGRTLTAPGQFVCGCQFSGAAL